MKTRPKIGLTGELKFTVGQEHVIDFATGGMPSVLSTPRLIGMIERTARETLQPLLDESERTVGVEVELRHLAPTPPGIEVTCRVKVIYVDPPFVSFQVEAHDPFEMIARGLHRRAVVQVESIARRVARKS